MNYRRILLSWLLGLLPLPAYAGQPNLPAPALQNRWLFVWRNMSDTKEVDRVIARLPKAKAAGYNGVVLSPNIAPAKAVELREAAQRHGLDLVAIVMGNSRDRNYMEGLPVKDALFVARDGVAVHQPDNPTRVANGDFEEFTGNHFARWGFQDDEGATTFVDTDVKHGARRRCAWRASARTSTATAASCSRSSFSPTASIASPYGSRPKAWPPPIPKSSS